MKTYSTINDFINDYRKCTFGLNMVTCTDVRFNSKANDFIGCNVVKVAIYKNIMCGCSYQTAIKESIKRTQKLKGTMEEAVNNAVDGTFHEKLGWGKWKHYPFIIDNVSKSNGEYHEYLRAYSSFKRTKIKTFYIEENGVIEKGSARYNLLMSQMKDSPMSKKQVEFGLTEKVIPPVFKFENILHLGQGEKLYQNFGRLSDKYKSMITEILTKEY